MNLGMVPIFIGVNIGEIDTSSLSGEIKRSVIGFGDFIVPIGDSSERRLAQII